MPSTDFIEEVHKVSGGEYPLVIATISHPDLPDDIRIVNDNEGVTSNGLYYQPLRFSISWPNQPETGPTETRISVDNVGRILTSWIGLSYGGRGTTITLAVILRSNPDVEEIPGIEMRLTDIQITSNDISGRLSTVDLVNRRFNPVVYSPRTALGLY